MGERNDAQHQTGSSIEKNPPRKREGARAEGGQHHLFETGGSRTKGLTGEAGGGARAPRLPGGRPLEAVARGAPPQGRQLAEHAHVAGRRPPSNCQARVNNGQCCQSNDARRVRNGFSVVYTPGGGSIRVYGVCALFSSLVFALDYSIVVLFRKIFRFVFCRSDKDESQGVTC